MKFLNTLLIILIAAVVSYGVVKTQSPQSESAEVKESAYDRVMRTGVLRCGYYIWPPFYDMDPNTKELSGLSRDVVDALGSLLGLKIDYVSEVIPGQQVEAYKRGDIDAICGDGAWVIALSKHIDFTDPIFYVPTRVYGRKGEVDYKTMNHTETRFIGLDGDLSQELAMARYPKAKHATLPAISMPSDLMLHVTTGKADYIVIDPISISEFEASNGDLLDYDENESPAIYWVGMSVAKGETDLLRMLNIGIDAANNLGIYQNIFKKYPELRRSIYPSAPRFMEN